MHVRQRFPLAIVLACALSAACAPPAPQQCQRYDALSLNPENRFSSRLDWRSDRLLDLPMERIEVAISAVRPMKGPVELVHVVGNTETDHWTLTVPDFNNAPITICTIQMAGTAAVCGATVVNTPFSPGGYYYLKAGENRVLEAGLAFYLCD